MCLYVCTYLCTCLVVWLKCVLDYSRDESLMMFPEKPYEKPKKDQKKFTLSIIQYGKQVNKKVNILTHIHFH